MDLPLDLAAQLDEQAAKAKQGQANIVITSNDYDWPCKLGMQLAPSVCFCFSCFH